MGKALRARLVVGPRMGANGEVRATKGGDLGIEEGNLTTNGQEFSRMGRAEWGMEGEGARGGEWGRGIFGD